MKRLLLVVILPLSQLFTFTIVNAGGWDDPIVETSIGCCGFMSGCSGCSDHLGIDYLAPLNTPVYAIGPGYEVNYYSQASSFGGCAAQYKGGALWIKHRKSNGQYFWVLYGHIKNPVYTGLAPGQIIPAGVKIAEINHYDPCCGGGGDCPHLHLGIWDGDPYRASDWGYGAQGSFQNPDVFRANNSPWPENSYSCSWVTQNPNQSIWTKPGDVRTYWVKYRNTGTATWVNAGGVDNPNHVELWSCDGQGSIVNSWFDPVGWINIQRVTTCDEGSVPPNGIATFTFDAQTPNVPSRQNVQVYFRPTHGVQTMENWGRMNYLLNVDADAPQIPPSLVATPPSNNVNSFSFSWSASSDGESGVSGYYWKVNGGGESFTTGTSLPAGGYAASEGTNTFYVRAADIVGNLSGFGSVSFEFSPGGCGPTLPNCSGGGSASGVLAEQNSSAQDTRTIGLPEHSAGEWRAMGQRASDLLLPGAIYRIGFQYRTKSDTKFGWGLIEGRSRASVVEWPGTTLRNPTNDGEWHQFWSAPFTVTAEQLARDPAMVLILGEDGEPGAVEINRVELCRASVEAVSPDER